MKDTIILDLKKVSNEKGFDKATDLFNEIHENSAEEVRQLRVDLLRAPLIIDHNGKRVECRTIQEFLNNTTFLTNDQQIYIQNIAHQGLMGGGSTFIPVAETIMGRELMLVQINSTAGMPTNDVRLCVYANMENVKLAHSMNFRVGHIENVENTPDNVTLSMVADISHLQKGKEREMPIYMIASQDDKKIDITGAIRNVQGQAEEKDDSKVKELESFIQKARGDKEKDILSYNATLANDHEINKMVQESLDLDKSLDDRKKQLSSKLRTIVVTIPQDAQKIGVVQEMEAKIYHYLTTRAVDHDTKRREFGAKKVVEYVSMFEGKNAIKYQKPSSILVSNILSSLTDDTHQKQIIQKNAPMILRQAMDSKNLSYVDRVKKIFDTITMAITFDRKDIKQVIKKIKSTKASKASNKGAFVEQISSNATSKNLPSMGG